jgi:inositol phosphorylceramide mannosyltransferase catalytic subunit
LFSAASSCHRQLWVFDMGIKSRVRKLLIGLTFLDARNRASFDRWYARLPDVPRSSGIPRLIHQTARNKALAPALAQAVEKARLQNPDWQHVLYDDAECSDFIRAACGPEVWNAYNRINPAYGAARADFFRYVVSYVRGGVYADIKTDFVRPFAETIRPDDQFIVSSWDNGPGGTHPDFGKHPDLARFRRDEIQQWFIVSAAGHPFLKAAIARVLANIETYDRFLVGTGKIGVLRTTGPIAYTAAIAPLLDRYDHREVANEKAVGLEYSIAGEYDHKSSIGAHYSELSSPVII